MLRNLTCLLTLATLALTVSCSSTGSSSETEPEGPALRCRVHFDDDVGLPRHWLFNAELRLYREGTLERVGRAYSCTSFDLVGNLQKDDLPLTELTGHLTVSLSFERGMLILQRQYTFTNPRLVDDELVLDVDIKASDVDKNAKVIVGRVEMPDGRPVADQPIRIRPALPLGTQREFGTTTDFLGRFCIQTTLQTDFDAPSVTSHSFEEPGVFEHDWRYTFADEGHRYRPPSPFGWYPVQASRMHERVADLDTFVYPGALVEVCAPEGEFLGTSTVRLYSGKLEFTRGGRLPRTFAVPPGWYGYAIDARSLSYGGEDYTLHGMVEAPPGQRVSTSPDLLMVEYADVHITTPDGAPASGNVTMNWQGVAECQDGKGSRDLTQPFKILTGGRPELYLQVHAPGYEIVDRRVPPGTKRIYIALQREASQEAEPGALLIAEVVLPELVAGTGFTLHATHESREVVQDYSVVDYFNFGHAIRLSPPGKWTVRLLGGAGWGYPGGLMCDPVTVEVGEDPEVVVQFEVPAPPSPKGSHRVELLTSVDGREVSLENVPTETPLGREPLQRLYNAGSSVPTALLVGERRLPVEYQPPVGYGDAKLICDLERRIRVRFPERLTNELQPTVAARALDGGPSCHAIPKNGEAWLWLPPGRADVVVHGAVELFRAEVEVVEGEEVVLDADLQCARVRFQHGWGEGVPLPDRERTQKWLVQQVDGEESFYAADEQQNIWGYLLAPGIYRALALHPYTGGCEFEVIAGKDITVPLTASGLRTKSSLRLGLPRPPVEGLHRGMFIARRKVGESRDLQLLDWRIANDAIELGPLLDDADWLIRGVYATGQRAWWLVPLELPAGASRGRVRATWRLAARMGPGWEAIEGNLSVRLHDDEPWTDLVTGHIPLGEIELRVYSGDQEHVFQCTLPRTDGEAGLPETLQQQLRDTGLLD